MPRRTGLISATDSFGFPLRMFGRPITSDGNWKQPVPPGDYSEWRWIHSCGAPRDEAIFSAPDLTG